MKQVGGSSTVQAAARDYIKRGWAIVPIPKGKKAPSLQDWPDLRLTEDDIQRYFSSSENLGVILGEPSGGLVDIDLDAPEAAALAHVFLPKTQAVFGRVSKPQSHLLYKAQPVPKSEKFTDVDGTVLVELRSTRSQTVFPPSTHPSSEQIRWDFEEEPAQMDASVLHEAVSKLAAATLLARHWPKGSRHESALALAGALATAGWSADEAEAFVSPVIAAAGDEELKDRIRAVRDTVKKAAAGEPVTGLNHFEDLIDKKVVERVREWLNLSGQRWPDEVNAKNLTENPPPPPQFIIADLLPMNRITFLIGKPKKGKSTFTTQLALHVIGERPLWGHASMKSIVQEIAPAPLGEPIDVLYFALEEDDGLLADRILKQLSRSVQCHRLHLFWTAPLLGQGFLEFLEEQIRIYPDTRLVIIDPFVNILPLESRTNPYQREYRNITLLKRFAKTRQVAFWICHHARKAEAQEVTDASLSTSGQPGAADLTILLKRTKQEKRASLHTEGRVGRPIDLVLEYDADHRLWNNLGPEEQVVHKELEQQIIAFAEQVGVDKDITPHQVATETGAKASTVRRTLREMVTREILVNPTYGKYRLYSGGEQVRTP